jgi:hypothetical protein
MKSRLPPFGSVAHASAVLLAAGAVGKYRGGDALRRLVRLTVEKTGECPECGRREDGLRYCDAGHPRRRTALVPVDFSKISEHERIHQLAMKIALRGTDDRGAPAFSEFAKFDDYTTEDVKRAIGGLLALAHTAKRWALDVLGPTLADAALKRAVRQERAAQPVDLDKILNNPRPIVAVERAARAMTPALRASFADGLYMAEITGRNRPSVVRAIKAAHPHRAPAVARPEVR